jgi:hypothetical protein
MGYILAYAGNVNLLADNIENKNKSIETLTGASNDVGPELNEEESKFKLPTTQ